jgi:acetate CoA/acetoacetate CoA-transferase alpha subunit
VLPRLQDLVSLQDLLMRAIPVEEAIALIPDGARVMIGGFIGVGTPERLLDEIVRQPNRGSR